ncbi:axonemal dynein light intermediate polypeptide 1-like [Diretmus argenteus]
MISPGESLLKYDNPVLVRGNQKESPKERPLRVGPQQSAITGPVPPPPKPKSASAPGKNQQTEEILNAIHPPREWMEGNQLWVQQVSSTPCTRMDVIRLDEQLDLMLQERQARETGLCPHRRELYSQCFDELIRQETISCAERGLLLLQVSNEIQNTIATSQALCESSVAFGMKKALQAEEGTFDMKQRISDLEKEKQELKKQVNEQKAKCEDIEERENEKRQVEEKQHTEEIMLLKRTNQQLKAQLEGIIRLKQ